MELFLTASEVHELRSVLLFPDDVVSAKAEWFEPQHNAPGVLRVWQGQHSQDLQCIVNPQVDSVLSGRDLLVKKTESHFAPYDDADLKPGFGVFTGRRGLPGGDATRTIQAKCPDGSFVVRLTFEMDNGSGKACRYTVVP